MTTDRERIAHLMKEKGIKHTIVYDARPSQEHPGAIGWRVTLKRNKHQMSSLFYTGYQQPTPEQVLEAWLNETHLILEGESYETWCNEKNLDPVEERSDQLFRKADRLAGYLEVFLGPDLKAFLYGS